MGGATPLSESSPLVRAVQGRRQRKDPLMGCGRVPEVGGEGPRGAGRPPEGAQGARARFFARSPADTGPPSEPRHATGGRNGNACAAQRRGRSPGSGRQRSEAARSCTDAVRARGASTGLRMACTETMRPPARAASPPPAPHARLGRAQEVQREPSAPVRRAGVVGAPGGVALFSEAPLAPALEPLPLFRESTPGTNGIPSHGISSYGSPKSGARGSVAGGPFGWGSLSKESRGWGSRGWGEPGDFPRFPAPGPLPPGSPQLWDP